MSTIYVTEIENVNGIRFAYTRWYNAFDEAELSPCEHMSRVDLTDEECERLTAESYEEMQSKIEELYTEKKENQDENNQ